MEENAQRKKSLWEYGVVIWVIITLNFFLPRAMPGDPFLIISGENDEEIAQFSDEQRAYYRELYGLDKPLPIQYGSYLFSLMRLDLGQSLYFNAPVSSLIVERLPWSLLLVGASIILSTTLGLLLGGVAALFRGLWIDTSLYFSLIVISEIPAFLLALMLLFLFSATLEWFPLSGAMTHFMEFDGVGARFIDIARHAVLPVISLTIVRMGGMFLLARNSMIRVLSKDYIRTAEAKGLSRVRILTAHIMRNAMLPVATRFFLSLGGFVGGAILVETVFSYPGLGYLMREAVLVQDYPLIQGIFLLVTVAVLLANFVADQIYPKLDPRIGG